MSRAKLTPPPHAPRIPRLPARLTVLVSGTGRTLLNLMGVIKAGDLSATIALVIASRECPGAGHAREAGIETLVIAGPIPAERLEKALDERAIDLVACAGYLPYLHVPPRYAGRIVNIHPALLPAFGGKGMYGGKVHAAVLAAGARQSGCTVHMVDERYDHGPILLQETCPVLAGDDPGTLAARVFELECRAYPAALQQLILRGVQA